MTTPSEQVAICAAQQWAQAHVRGYQTPAAFGADVMNVYQAARATFGYQGDAKTMAAALAGLSMPVESLQWLGRVASLLQEVPLCRTNPTQQNCDVSLQGQ